MQMFFGGDVRAYYLIEYEVTPRIGEPFIWSDGNPKISDDLGNVWGAIRDNETDHRPPVRQPDAIFQDRVIATLVPGGQTPSRVEITLPTNVRIPNEDLFEVQSLGGEFVFFDMPVECADLPSTDVSAATAGPIGAPVELPAGLVVPVRRAGPGLQTLDDDPSSTLFAVQMGQVWSFGDGVPYDFEQGQRWTEEAHRRQELNREFTYSGSITSLIRDYGVTDPVQLNRSGQQYAARSDFRSAGFYFQRSADLGDVQAMASLGLVYYERSRDSLGQIYWCRKAYLGARANGFLEQEIDTVNYFCPLEAFATLMTPSERRNNPASVARAEAKSSAIRRDVEAIAAIVTAFNEAASAKPASSHDGAAEHAFEQNQLRDRAYARQAREEMTGRREEPEPGSPF